MRIRQRALTALLLVLGWSFPVRGFSGPQFDPPPLPDPIDLPWPDDPPDILTDPFDPNDLPEPIDIPFPDEDFPDPFDDPLPLPDPPDLPDPFDEPSLFPDPWDDLPDLPDLPPPPPPIEPQFGFTAQMTETPRAAAATNAPVALMPFPMRLPFHPAYSGTDAAKAGRSCNAQLSTKLLVVETNKNTLALLNTCPFKIAQRITVGNAPLAVAVTPDAKFAWVTNGLSSSISIVDLTSKSVAGTIALPAFNGVAATPGSIAFLPDGSLAYVTNHDANPGSVIFVIDVPNRKLLTTIPTDAFPASVAVTPDGSQVWVPNRGDSTITVIDSLTNTVIAHVRADYPTGVAFNPTGTKAYVAEAELSGNGYVRVLDVASTNTLTRIQVGNLPHSVKVTPTGHYVFVTNLGSNNVSEINALRDKLIRNIPVTGKHPQGLAFVK